MASRSRKKASKKQSVVHRQKEIESFRRRKQKNREHKKKGCEHESGHGTDAVRQSRQGFLIG